MKLLLVLLLGANLSYSMTNDITVSEKEYAVNIRKVSELSIISDYNIVSSTAEPETAAEHGVVSEIKANTTYEHNYSESWWKSRFSYLEDK